MADDPTRVRDVLGRTSEKKSGVAKETTGVPKPGDPIDNPTASAATGEHPAPTLKNEPTARADTGETPSYTDTSTGTPTTRSDQPSSGGQSSGAKVASSLIKTRQEVDAEAEAASKR